jgi:WD40 repeat protein
MRQIILAIVLAGVTLAAAPQQATPATEVYLWRLTGEKGNVTPAWTNISNSPGYDNQPSFLPDSSGLLFSSNRDGKQTDIYRYDIKARALTQVTRTSEAEYSPIVTPDRRTFSTIRVEADGTQRLWRFDLDGSNPRLVLENIKPVGYHAWIDDTHLALFILGGGGGAPATLQIADTKTGTAEVIETGIGRSILIRPPTGTVSYITTGQTRTIKEWNPKTKTSAAIAAPFEASQDAAWTPGGNLLMANGTTISSWSPAASTPWTTFASAVAPDPSISGPPPVRSITRLTVSPDGNWLAFVAEPVVK